MVRSPGLAAAALTEPGGAARDAAAPIREHAVIGDGRTAALVTLDGTIDWLCLPNLDSAAVFGALLDSRRGGRFTVAPAEPFDARRRYLPGTNVLETTFRTARGAVTVTDAMTLPSAGLAPARELVRAVDGVSGTVPMRWRVEPRFGYGLRRTRFGRRAGVPVAESAGEAVAVCTWDAGAPRIAGGGVRGEFDARPGTRAVLALAAAHGEPLVLPSRGDVEERLRRTTGFWRAWVARRAYDGPWQGAVLRSALALKLLVFAPSGAISAAATTSLPEEPGGGRNWDYRYSWVRDSAFAVNALLQLGCTAEADAFFWWLMHASQRTRPRFQTLYRLDGGSDAPERALPLAGYRDARPVRIGNAAATQLQLDVTGALFQTAWLYARAGRPLDRDIARRLAAAADLVCRTWRRRDAGIWEVRAAPAHFTHSKMLCWVALDRAGRLADAGHLPGAGAARWRQEAAAVRAFVERSCWSERLGSYTRAAGREELDAALLHGVLFGYGGGTGERLERTVDAVRRHLAEGPFVRRYDGTDGVSGTEGAFLACSFWLVEALALLGRRPEANELMGRLVASANDVGLYAEEIDPSNGEFLGNFPQALVHLALVSAAVALGTSAGR